QYEKLRIRFFRDDAEGNIWIGTEGGGVRMYNTKKKTFEDNPGLNREILYRLGIVRAMETDRDNNLWIGTDDGLAYWNFTTGTGDRITLMDSVTVTNITALNCDGTGKLWIGAQASDEKPGLFTLDPATMRFRAIPDFRNIIPTAIVTDTRGTVWVGTAQGLIAYDNNSVISVVREEDGLLSNTIRSLVDGGDGSIYIGTNLGLNRYLPESGEIYAYTKKNGFPGIESRPGAVFRSGNGDIWFGTANGAVRLTPSKLVIRNNEPMTHIKELRDFSGSREMVEGLRRRYNDNDMIFDYYSICLTDPDVVEYRIMLAGFDDEWRAVADQTRAVYQKLPPGKYTFMVTARNNEGKWNSNPVSYSFTIKPPFWKTWWFIMVSAAVTLMGIALYIRIREGNLIREKLLLEERVRERTAEVVQKSVEIEEKNRDITASIRYAERIQMAMLPPEDTFSDTFVLFLPKDIVSGDFYWMYDNGDQQFIAAADCTGHGVPGAFMSIIGHNSLSKIVREYGITRPSAILDQLNVEVTRALLQRDEKAITDGMDIALITFDKKDSTVEYAGAFNPLYLVRNGELFIYRGDRIPIGMTRINVRKSYTNQKVDAQPGDMLYMFSDGYADQFGWQGGKKFKTANIRRLVTEIYHLPVAEQRSRLMDELLQWKGDLAQIDDILFIDTRIPGL
ncbi:MAG TPA: SpoIIE family protein phosphatase, partial [Bacteroidales bacterium]|nr:SpoIIE family protein phosphatase [Bacteroidales bacterium]